MTDLTAAALTFLAAWDANRARVGDLLVSEAVLAAVEGIRAALPAESEPERPPRSRRGMTVEEMAEAHRRFLASISGPLYDLREDEFSDW